MTPPDSFNPLLANPPDEELRFIFEQSKVRSVIDSYHGRLDSFAEGIQNAIDAVENRWRLWAYVPNESEAQDAIPRVRVILNADENALEVIDNGVGISVDHLAELLAPYGTDKRSSLVPTRGHKGVGTTFLAYGHPYFEIHTKTKDMTDAIGYRIEGGRAWALADKVTPPPDYVRLPKTHPSLSQYESGTYIKVGFDESTSLRNVSGVLHNSVDMWTEVLRSNTAMGNVALQVPLDQRPDWARNLVVLVEHRDGNKRGGFEFPLPHLMMGADAKELQWLQNNPSGKREYSLIYIERGHSSLRDLLASEIADLKNADDDESRRLLDRFNRYDISAYASLAYKNTLYEEHFRKQIKNPNAQRLSLNPGVGSGILVASVGMPMGALQAHLSETMLPQERRRYFLLLHFNEKYSPDIGRKTVPADLEPVVKWIESQLLRLLRTQDHRLLKDRASSTRPRGAGLPKAEEEVKAFTKQVAALEEMEHELDFDGLILRRTPEWEGEVTAIFTDLLSRGLLPGYKVRAIPGAYSRYDALFDYELNSSAQDSVPENLKVSEYALVDEPLLFSDRWLEFKKDINSFVEDLEAEDGSPSKKYFTHVDVLVVWSVSDLSTDRYSVDPVTNTNWKDRYYLGSTHFLRAENNDHRVEVLELRHILEELFPIEKSD